MKESQFKQLVRFMVKEAMDVFNTDPLAQGALGTGQELDPIAQQKMERDQRKMNRQKLQATQKVQKLEADKHKAETKTWKLKKRSFDKSVRDLKRTGV
jgi:hypothetical protein